MPARAIVEQLIVTADYPDQHGTAPFERCDHLPRLQAWNTAHTFSPIFVLNCSKIGSASPSSCKV
jgi:hypothetical protein